MSDATIGAWFAGHHMLASLAMLVIIGTCAGLVRERTPAEEALFKAAWPRLFALVKLAQTIGIDSRRVLAFGGAFVTGNIADALRVSSGTTVRPPPSTTVYPPERDHDDNP